MTTSLTFGRRAQGSIIIDGITTVEIDVRVSESHSFSSKTTDYPVEDGSILSDHVLVNPFSIGMTGIVSNTPIPTTGAVIPTTGNGERRSDTAYENLVKASREKKSVVYNSTLASYSGILTELSFPKDSTTGESIQFSATFKEIRKGFVLRADPQTFPNSNALSAQVSDRASSEINNGNERPSAWEEAQRRVALNNAQSIAERNP
jgi:hypothetical protein